MESESNMLLNNLLTWGVPVLWVLIAIFSYFRGLHRSAICIAIAGIASLAEPILFYAGYSLPTDWVTQSEPLQPSQYLAWLAQYVLPIVGVLGLFVGYLLAVIHNARAGQRVS